MKIQIPQKLGLTRNAAAYAETKKRGFLIAEETAQGRQWESNSPGPCHHFLEELKEKLLIYQSFYFTKTAKMPFLAVYRSVRLTTQINGILMLSSCLLWEIFRMIASSFYAG